MISSLLQQLLNQGKLGHATLLIGTNDLLWPQMALVIQKSFEVNPGDVTQIIHLPKIDQLREIIKKINLRPIYSQVSLLMIYHLELWRPEIATVLLKTIEEPPVHLKIILFSKNEFAVLPTVRSRATTFYLDNTNVLGGETLMPTLEQLNQESLSQRFKTITNLVEKNSLSDIINHWLITAPVDFQSELLELTNMIGDIPVNKRLVLELITTKYYQQYSLKGGENVS